MTGGYRCLACGKYLTHDYLHYLTHLNLLLKFFLMLILMVLLLAWTLVKWLYDIMGRLVVVHDKTQIGH